MNVCLINQTNSSRVLLQGMSFELAGKCPGIQTHSKLATIFRALLRWLHINVFADTIHYQGYNLNTKSIRRFLNDHNVNCNSLKLTARNLDTLFQRVISRSEAPPLSLTTTLDNVGGGELIFDFLPPEDGYYCPSRQKYKISSEEI